MGTGGLAEAVGPSVVRTEGDMVAGVELEEVSGSRGVPAVVPGVEVQWPWSQHSRRTWKLWQYGTRPGWSRLRHTSPKLTLHWTTCPTSVRLTSGAFSERHSMSWGCSQKT